MKMLVLLTVVSGFFWNVENFFDYEAQTEGKSDVEFSAGGGRKWTSGRFYRKCNAVAKTVLASAQSPDDFPDFVALAEVENSFVASQVIRSTPLAKLGYSYVHFDSYDHRGIDCALLYRKGRMKLLSASPCHIWLDNGEPMATRDILLAIFGVGADTLAVLVNHHPSKVGASGGKSRERVMGRLEELRDSLLRSGVKHVFAVGDFNDDIWRGGPPEGWPEVRVPDLAREDHGQSRDIPGRLDTPAGTIKYNGAWEKIDGCLYSGVRVDEKIFAFAPLLTSDTAFGGLKPLRTYSGPRYLGGVSDHLPLVLRISF